MPPYNHEFGGKLYTVMMPGMIPIKVERVWRAIARQIEAGKKSGKVTMSSTDGEKFTASWAPYKAKAPAAATKAKAKPRPPTPAKPKLQRQKRRHT